MHGYFVDNRLYKKASSLAEPFAFEEYRKKKNQEKVKEDRVNRVQLAVRFYSLIFRGVQLKYFLIFSINFLKSIRIWLSSLWNRRRPVTRAKRKRSRTALYWQMTVSGHCLKTPTLKWTLKLKIIGNFYEFKKVTFYACFQF